MRKSPRKSPEKGVALSTRTHFSFVTRNRAKVDTYANLDYIVKQQQEVDSYI